MLIVISRWCCQDEMARHWKKSWWNSQTLLNYRWRELWCSPIECEDPDTCCATEFRLKQRRGVKAVAATALDIASLFLHLCGISKDFPTNVLSNNGAQSSLGKWCRVMPLSPTRPTPIRHPQALRTWHVASPAALSAALLMSRHTLLLVALYYPTANRPHPIPLGI